MGREPRSGARSTMDQQRCGHEATRAWQRACQSVASGCSETRKLTNEGREWSGEDGDSISPLARARGVARWPGDGSGSVIPGF
jgi:hypothetical protein